MTEDLNEIRLTYPRVSDIIGKQTREEMQSIPLDVLANAALRGTRIHEYASSHLQGLWIPEIETEYQPYTESFKIWADENIDRVLVMDKRLYDDVQCFSGQFDMIVILKSSKKTALIDLKTSHSVSKSWPIQLAAYKHLCEINGHHIDSVYNLHLKKSSLNIKSVRIPYTEKDITSAWEIFSSALRCYKYFTLNEALSC